KIEEANVNYNIFQLSSFLANAIVRIVPAPWMAKWMLQLEITIFSDRKQENFQFY
ncbi:hypothetical protein MKW98_003287, partial [Papaver atlanticum]